MLPHLSKLFKVCFSNSSTQTAATFKNLFSWHRPAVDFLYVLFNIVKYSLSKKYYCWMLALDKFFGWERNVCIFNEVFHAPHRFEKRRTYRMKTGRQHQRASSTMCRLLETHLLILKSDLGCNSGKYDLSSWQAMNHKLSSV